MRNKEAPEVLREVLAIVGGADWEVDKDRLRTELVEYLTDDLFVGGYQVVNVPVNLQLAETSWTGNDQVEITARGFGLPYRATLVRGSDGGWA